MLIQFCEEKKRELGWFISCNPADALRKEIPNVAIYRKFEMLLPDRKLILQAKYAGAGF